MLLAQFLIILALILLVKYHWNRRWLYYHGSKFKGPFAWPILGNALLFFGKYEDSYKTLTNLVNSQSPTFRVWLGRELVVVTTEPAYVETILSNSVDRFKSHNLEEIFHTGLITAPVDVWKVHRRIINRSFNTKTINSFVSIIDKHVTQLMTHLEDKCDDNYVEVLEPVFRCNMDIACETMTDVDSRLVEGQSAYMANTRRMTEISMIRASNICLTWNCIWRCTSLHREMKARSKMALDFVRQIIQIKKAGALAKDSSNQKLVLNNLLNESDRLTETEILEETNTMFLSSTETTAITVSLALCLLGLYPEIQKNVREELNLVFGKKRGSVTLEDINRMDYLERVIKETMRLFPVVPIVRRTIHKDIALGSRVLPKGSSVLIPPMCIHTSPDIWKNPLQFDPDRFLPENERNRPRCSFIPFSHGLRNCIGVCHKYAMLSMKITLSIFLTHYKVKSTEYKSIEDVEFWVKLVALPKRGCKIKLEKIYE
ncbi:unnamed protein product [Tenebrio molitor]|nr:unnamed protein product [Tenebrio molitor]